MVIYSISDSAKESIFYSSLSRCIYTKGHDLDGISIVTRTYIRSSLCLNIEVEAAFVGLVPLGHKPEPLQRTQSSLCTRLPGALGNGDAEVNYFIGS